MAHLKLLKLHLRRVCIFRRGGSAVNSQERTFDGSVFQRLPGRATYQGGEPETLSKSASGDHPLQDCLY